MFIRRQRTLDRQSGVASTAKHRDLDHAVSYECTLVRLILVYCMISSSMRPHMLHRRSTFGVVKWYLRMEKTQKCLYCWSFVTQMLQCLLIL